MKTVLGIISSTRKKGNSELAAKMVSRHIPESHSLNLIRLSDLNIRPCLGCYHCMSKDGQCVHDDDMEIFLDGSAQAFKCLFPGGFFLSKDSGNSKRTLKTHEN